MSFADLDKIMLIVFWTLENILPFLIGILLIILIISFFIWLGYIIMKR